MTAKTVNYTPEMTAAVIEGFKEGKTVEAIALEVGKTVRSVIAKLSKEGVYTAKAKENTSKRKAETKAAMLAKVEAAAGVAPGTFATFEKGSAPAVKALMEAFASDFEADAE
jgi:hypothetical protein